MDQMEDGLKTKQTKNKKKSESLCSGNEVNICTPVMAQLFLSLTSQSLTLGSCESVLSCHTHAKGNGSNCSGEKKETDLKSCTFI